MRSYNNELINNRITFIFFGVFLLFVILISRLFFLQVINRQKYELLSDKNRIYTSFSAAPRGVIYDRNGIELAESIFEYQAVIDLNQYKNDEYVWSEIRNNLNLSTELTFKNFVNEQIKKTGPSRLIVIKDNLTWNEIVKTEVLSSTIPGLFTSKKIIRHYPFSEIFCHVIGYVTTPNQNDIDKDQNLNILGANIGKFGIEQYFDLTLRGDVGVKQHEVNASRRFVRVIDDKKPKIGKSLYLTIDYKLQMEVFNIMKDVRKGAAIIIDVETGAVLAMVSNPSFDPNIFTQKIDKDDWQKIALNKDNPLINRAISGLYSPGSTFKMVVAMAALKENIINDNSEFYCHGFHDIKGRRFHCWKWRTGGHGNVNLCQAIEKSCDVFFYKVSEKLGPNKIIDMAKNIGIGSKTGIQLINEKNGNLPNISLQWKKEGTGQALNLSIGQGSVLMTPIQMACLAATIGTGKIIKPTLCSLTKNVFDNLQISNKHINLIKKGMKDAVNSGYGTATLAKNQIIEIAGKTGSTQVVAITNEERKRGKLNERPYEYRDHAMFIGYAPADKPKFAVAVIVEHGGSGGKVAAPIAKEILIAANNIIK